eukprot:1474524-Rhodomonas_salina.1
MLFARSLCSLLSRSSLPRCPPLVLFCPLPLTAGHAAGGACKEKVGEQRDVRREEGRKSEE